MMDEFSLNIFAIIFQFFPAIVIILYFLLLIMPVIGSSDWNSYVNRSTVMCYFFPWFSINLYAKLCKPIIVVPLNMFWCRANWIIYRCINKFTRIFQWFEEQFGSDWSEKFDPQSDKVAGRTEYPSQFATRVCGWVCTARQTNRHGCFLTCHQNLSSIE